MMAEVGAWILGHTQWLYVRLLESPISLLDLWSFVNFWCGLVLFGLLRILRCRRPWIAMAALLLAWELLELMFIYAAFGAFRPETLKDQVTDIAVGMLGGVLFQALGRRYQRTPKAEGARFLHRFSTLMVALTLAFVWVGHYGYRYGVEALNSPGLNWLAFLAWSTGLIVLAQYFAWALRILGRPVPAMAVTWLTYFPLLLALEYLGHDILGIREVGHLGRQPLLFGLINGTPSLHCFYLSVPFTSAAGLALAKRFFASAFAAEGTIGDADPAAENSVHQETAAESAETMTAGA